MRKISGAGCRPTGGASWCSAFEHDATAHLRNTFAPLKAGDSIVVSYVPGRGTLLRVNKAVVASGASHDLVLAFLDHWLGQRLVSEDLKRAIWQTWSR